MRCSGWWTCGLQARPAQHLDLRRRGSSTNSDPLEKQKRVLMQERGVRGDRAEIKALRESESRALELLGGDVTEERRAELEADTLVRFVLKDAEANVLCPATKLWNTGQGATMMREAVSLMGGYGITEDCPGFLGNKWMDAQLEATYEGPEAVQRRQLTITMTGEVVPGAVPRLDQGDAWHRVRAPGHRRMHAGDGDDDVAVDAELHAAWQRMPTATSSTIPSGKV